MMSGLKTRGAEMQNGMCKERGPTASTNLDGPIVRSHRKVPTLIMEFSHAYNRENHSRDLQLKVLNRPVLEGCAFKMAHSQYPYYTTYHLFTKPLKIRL
jgi:hypothetical protein